MFGLTKLHGAALRAAVLSSSGLAFLCFGYDQGVLGGILENTAFLKAMNNPTADEISTITSIYQIGCVFGCMLAALIGLRLGRRWTIIVGCMLVIVGGAVQAAAIHPGMMIAARVVAGLGTGLTSSTVPPWVAECAKPGVRGRDIAIELSIVLFGITLAYWTDIGLAKYGGEVAWRFPVALQCAFMIIAAAIIYDLPESPHVLFYWNREQEAHEVLSRLRGKPLHDAEVQSTLFAISEAVRLEKSVTQPIWRSLFWDDSEFRNSRRVFLIFWLQAFQQLGGNNVIVYYQTILFKTVLGLKEQTTLLLGGFASLTYFIGTLPAIYTIEKWGRRPLLLWGAFGCGICTMLFTISVAKSAGLEPGSSWGWLGCGAIFAYNFIFANTWCAPLWVYPPEISPTQYRHLNSAVGPLAEWLFTFVTVKSTPPALEAIGYKIYVLYTVMTFVAVAFVYFLVPETAGRTIEELEALFSVLGYFPRSSKKEMANILQGRTADGQERSQEVLDMKKEEEHFEKVTEVPTKEV